MKSKYLIDLIRVEKALEHLGKDLDVEKITDEEEKIAENKIKAILKDVKFTDFILDAKSAAMPFESKVVMAEELKENANEVIQELQPENQKIENSDLQELQPEIVPISEDNNVQEENVII